MLDVGPRINQKALASLHSIIDPLPESFTDRAEASEFLPRESSFERKNENALRNVPSSQSSFHRWTDEVDFDLSGIRTALLKAIDHDNRDYFRK